MTRRNSKVVGTQPSGNADLNRGRSAARSWGALLVSGVLFLSLLMWPGSANRLEILPAESSQESEALLSSSVTNAPFGILGFHLYESKLGEPHWNLQAEFAELFRNENVAKLRGVQVEFFTGGGSHVVRATSDQGLSRLDREELELSGDVRVRSSQGYLVRLKRAHYNGEKQLLTSKDALDLKGPNPESPEVFVSGVGLRGQIDREQFNILKDVSVRKLMSTGQWLRIYSREGEFFAGTGRGRFRGGVKTYLPKVQIRSDMFELSSSKSGEEELLAVGRVHVYQARKLGRANRASLKVGSNLVVLEGQASVEEKGNRLAGHRIVLNVAEDKIQVIGAEGNINNDAQN